MEEILVADSLTKTFTLSARQRKKEKTESRVKTAVNNLSFTVYKGEIFGLLGPNGAGKTTTLRMLATLIKPDGGSATICGKSVIYEQEEVRKKIGFLTGELKLEGFFTPDYLFDFFSDLYGVDKSTRDERKRALFSRFGIDKFAHDKVSTLSTGMKQKVSLAISVAHNPELVIFDEPTNGLDVLTAKLVTDFIQEMKAEGKTIILSTHIFSLVEKLCDRVGIIFDGRLRALDSLKSLTAEKPLEDVFFDLYKSCEGAEL